MNNAVQPEGFSENVNVLDLSDKRVYLIGTAHISAKSADEVEQVIAQVKPDTVAVELCEARHKALTQEQAWKEMDIIQVIRKKQATMLLAHMIMASFQRRLGDKLGVRPGAEMVAALNAAEKAGAEVVLADRSIQITLLRTWRNMRFLDKVKVMGHMMFSLVGGGEELDEAEIEELKSQDMLSEVMEGFTQSFPRAKASLIDERDQFLAEKIRSAPGKVVVAVVGAGHVKGMLPRLQSGEASDLDAISQIPPKSIITKIIQWGIPLGVLGLIAYGFVSADANVSWEMIKIWVLANGILSSLGAALAFAHPITIATAFVAAPLTSLNPMVAAGWVAGLVEALVHKPRVKDFEALATDITSFRGFWQNRVTRILLVVALANLGSSIGTFVGIPLMSSLLAG